MLSNTIIPAIVLPTPEIPRDLLSSHSVKVQEPKKKEVQEEPKGTSGITPDSDLIDMLLNGEVDHLTPPKKETKPEVKKVPNNRTAQKKAEPVKKPEVKKENPAKAKVQAEESRSVEMSQEKETLYLYGPRVFKELSDHHFIGSDKRCADISIGGKEGKYISARHAEIIRIGDSFYIEDTGSRNGTFVNGRRIESGRRMRIFAGDVIRLANVEINVEREAA